MRLNVIIGNRSERLSQLHKQLEEQGITDYELWQGVFLPSVKASINAAHKQIVRYAQLAGWKSVAIAEDDLLFTSKNSWKYFLDHLPSDYDLYLSMVYLGQPDENNIVTEFTGMTMYVVNERFYETFLSVDPNEHIDRALAGLGKYVVCNPFVAKQSDGFSSNTGKFEQYEDLLKNRTFL